MVSIHEALLLAVEHHRADRLAEADAIYRQVLQVQPDHPDALYLSGLVAKRSGDRERALDLIGRAIAGNPGFAEAHFSLGSLLHDLGRPAEAAARYRRVLDLKPDHGEARNLLLASWLAFFDTPRSPEEVAAAVAAERRRLAADPTRFEPYLVLGVAFHHEGRLDEAAACYRQALALAPDFPLAHHLLGLTLLLRGDFREAYAECEWRHVNMAFRSSEHQLAGVPVWDGRPLPDGTVLLMAESGLGDTFQMIRYAPLVAERCRRVVAIVQTPLIRLLTRAIGSERILVNPEHLPEPQARAQLMSLPHLMDATPDTIPAPVPYLSAEADRVAAWAARLAGRPGLRVGIAWQGSNGNARTIPLDCFAPLAGVPGVRLISLHTRTDAAQREARFPLETLGADLDRDGAFVDTAAVMMNLDLIVTLDTSIVHLAGALGRPVWLALKHIPDCRWFLGRDDSPWYPTLRLFRQERPGDWAGVFARIEAALTSLIR